MNERRSVSLVIMSIGVRHRVCIGIHSMIKSVGGPNRVHAKQAKGVWRVWCLTTTIPAGRQAATARA